MKTSTLFYIHDPMCSWCYAFKPVLQQLQHRISQDKSKNIGFESLLGGLATDTDAPMPEAMRQQLQNTWQRIEQKVSTAHFNHDFWDNWQQTNPRRATFAACRAVIAAHRFDLDDSKNYEILMITAIQNAYYQQAQNPSDETVLLRLANQIGLEEQTFQSVLQAPQTQLELDKQIIQGRQMNVRSYPSLVLKIGQGFWPVSIDYLSVEPILESIDLLLEFEEV